jgi:hypothetical protein
MNTVKEGWNMCCPNCGLDDKLSVEANVWVELMPDGVESSGDNLWTDISKCECTHNGCNWNGNVGEAYVGEAV